MKHLRTLRVVFGFWLAAWFINAPGDPGFLRNFHDALSHPLNHAAFPTALTDPRVAFAIYLAPLGCIPFVLLRTQNAWRGVTALTTLASGLACLHLETCNDATFVTTFWVSLWMAWLAHNADRSGRRVLAIGRGLAHAVIGLIFLGALVGKLTPEFRSGEAFFGLYFVNGHDFPYAMLREGRSPAEYRELATWFTRAAISAEAMLAASPVLPTRFVLPFYLVVMIGMMVARNYHLFSVLGAPLGLLIGAELMRREQMAPGSRRREPARPATAAA